MLFEYTYSPLFRHRKTSDDECSDSKEMICAE